MKWWLMKVIGKIEEIIFKELYREELAESLKGDKANSI